MQVPHTPVETSSFGRLPRDLAHLVLVQLPFPCLCLLKAVSRETANACRRALLSREHLAPPDDEADKSYMALLDILRGCNLSFPTRAFISHIDPDFHLPVWCEQDLSGNEFVVHDFNIEFFRKGCRITDSRILTEWWYFARDNQVNLPRGGDSEDGPIQYGYDEYANAPGLREHLKSITVDVSRFCVEHVGVGIFHSPDALWDSLDLENKIRMQLDDDPHTSPYYMSGHYEYRVVELAARLIPHAQFGGLLFPFDQHLLPSYKKRLFGMPDNIGHTGSLFHCFINNRIV